MSFSFIIEGFDHIILEVLTAVIPVLILFLFFIFYFKMPRKMLLNLLKGIIFAFAGLTLFLQGVNIGFMPVALEMGSLLGGMSNHWILIPIGFILGFVATLAEPAVRILCRQVEKSSSGSIKNQVMMYTLCFAVGLFIALGMARIVFGIPFNYIIVPGYLLVIILTFFAKPSFTAIAFDSGGVATGPMTVTFIMALAVGAADAIEGRDSVADGFGLIAMVALAPIIMVMLLGFLYPNDDQYPQENVNEENEDLPEITVQEQGKDIKEVSKDTRENSISTEETVWISKTDKNNESEQNNLSEVNSEEDPHHGSKPEA